VTQSSAVGEWQDYRPGGGAARIDARLSAELAADGTAVGPHDLIIAATALTKGYIVTTRDERSFPRIPGLSYQRG
jgi:predicted nucleic acid-binding protein